MTAFAAIDPHTFNYSVELLERTFAPLPTYTPSEWVGANVELRTPSFKSHWTFEAREYMREPIDEVSTESDARYQTCCWGTGAGKTTKNLGQMLYAFAHEPFSGLYVMPAKEGEGGAKPHNNNVVIPSIEAMACFADKIPKGKDRHNFSGQRLVFAGNNLGFVGANSAAQLGAKRCRVIWLDEQDKYKEKLGREEGADYLANERTKQVPNKKIIRGSTPTRENVGIWPHLIASDLRRRFLLCPHCHQAGKRFVLIKDEQFTVLPTKFEDGTLIPFAQLRWDKEAKRKDGSWDKDRVFKSARFECPHCGGHIVDRHRIWLDKNGLWIPTRPSVKAHSGYHLPSFYAPHVDFDSSWGGMALKFLDAHESGKMHGYINSDLAEVYTAQELGTVELVSDQTFAQADWIPLMSVDFQKLWPFIWFVVQKFSSFKIQPPFRFVDNKPEFALHLEKNPKLKEQCEKIVAGADEAWKPLAELLRFDPCTGDFPPLDFLISKQITGQSLVKLFADNCRSNTLDFGRYIYGAMGVPIPKGGDSEVIAAGHCEMSGDDAWNELREIQQQFHVGEIFTKLGASPNRAVIIDSGYAEEHNPEVLRKCFESGFSGRWIWYDPITKQFNNFRTHAGCLPAPIDCWIPFKGYPIRKRWKAGGVESSTHWAADDPFKGLGEAGKYSIQVLEAASELYFHKWMDDRDRQKEVIEAKKKGKSYRGNLWSVANTLELFPKNRFTFDDFNRQMNARGRDSDGKIWDRGTGGGGKRMHPDHLNDACRNIYALAETHGFFSYEPKQ